MITLDIQNILQHKIGRKHGLSHSVLKRFAQKHQKDLDVIFRKSREPGYAFVTLASQAKLLKKIDNYVSEQKKNKWKNIVVLGIGGSALGLIALKEALLDDFAQSPRLFVLDNVDPVTVDRLKKNLKLSETLFIVISKSGTTVEPMALYNVFQPLLKKKFPKDYQKHLLFITDPKEGLLREIAKKEEISTFDIPPQIGGRFSVLTAVGLAPAALAGIDVSKLLKGAKATVNLVRKTEGIQNPALALACIQFLMDRKKNKPMTVLMPYSNLLFRMGDWYRQLLAESIGKNPETGPTPLTALGTTDQHSQIQLYMEGPPNKLLMFLRVQDHGAKVTLGKALPEPMDFLNGKTLDQIMEAARHGTAEALAKNGRPNLTLCLNKINEEHLGALFMLLEFQVALLGELYGVNAYNQPGVEEGKQIAKTLLSDKMKT